MAPARLEDSRARTHQVTCCPRPVASVVDVLEVADDAGIAAVSIRIAICLSVVLHACLLFEWDLIEQCSLEGATMKTVGYLKRELRANHSRSRKRDLAVSHSSQKDYHPNRKRYMRILLFEDLNYEFNTHTWTILSTIDFELDTRTSRFSQEFTL